VGRTVAIPQPVKRIISLAPNLTETLFAIGVGDRLVGDTDFCDYPPEAKTKPHVGGTDSPNLERIAQLRPDLIFATRSGGNRLATVQSLESLGLAVFATDPHSVDDVIASTERMGEIAGAGDRGRAVAAKLRSRMQDLSRRLAGVKLKKVFVVVWPEPLVTVGKNTFIADALRNAGAENVIETGQDWPNVSLEEVVRLQPEYLLFVNNHSHESDRQAAELARSPGWRNLDALRNNRVIVLNEEISRPAPRLLDQIEQLARMLHPERFATGANL
jgi:iron complex transport system substrate-binding protein